MTKQGRRNYSYEFKDEAVKLVTDLGYSVAEAARDFGLNANLLVRWKKEKEHERFIPQGKKIPQQVKGAYGSHIISEVFTTVIPRYVCQTGPLTIKYS